MKESIKWGFLFGIIAFLANILLPGIIEPFVAWLVTFLAAMLTVKRNHVSNRMTGIRLGIITGLVAGIVIIITDAFISTLLALGYLYKDQIPWLQSLEFPSFITALGNITLVILVIFLCNGMIKIGMALLGGAMGGALFTIHPQKPLDAPINHLTNGLQ